METGIPPLLPASPPPMCKDDFNEDEADIDEYAHDEEDEFGDFSTATTINHFTKTSTDSGISCDNSTFNANQNNLSNVNMKESLDLKAISVSLSADIANNEQKQITVQLSTLTTTDNRTILNDIHLSSLKAIENEATSISFTEFDEPSVCDAAANETYSDLNNDNVRVSDDNVLGKFTNVNEASLSDCSQVINSPSLSDSDSIDIPSDHFIVGEVESPKHELDTVSVDKNNDKFNLEFANFETNNDTKRTSFDDESREEGTSLFTKAASDKTEPEPAVLFEQDFIEGSENSNNIFQDFVDVTTTLPCEEVTNLSFGNAFDSESTERLGNRWPSEIGKVTNESLPSKEELLPPPPLEFEANVSDDDDDFSDFVSPTEFVADNQVPVLSAEFENDVSSVSSTQMQFDKFESAPGSSIENDDADFGEMCSFKQSTSCLSPQTLNWTEIFCIPAQVHVEVNLNTIEGKLNGSSVWCKIKDIETSPALNYSWNDSEANKLLLATLCVDSRNILFGPRWNSEVPRFASNLGFTPLVPQKASEKSLQSSAQIFDTFIETNAEISAALPEAPGPISTVPDAHFDWNNSGLTNPLDSYSHSSLLDLDLLASFDIHSPYYKKKRKSEKSAVSESSNELQSSLSIFNRSEIKTLSTEAETVLNSLPNLAVMEKGYIVFPSR